MACSKHHRSFCLPTPAMHTLRPICLIASLALPFLLSAAAPAAEPLPETRVALERLSAYSAGQKPADRKLVFVYFTPSDREPPDGFRERLTRVMTDIQKFYAGEMERHGFGRRTIRFDRDEHRPRRLSRRQRQAPGGRLFGR